MIWGLAWSGHWLWMSIDKTVTGTYFSIFIFILWNYITKCFNKQSKSITIWVDNASIHLTSKWRTLWKVIGIEILGIPKYWPHLAACDIVFGMTKKILSQRARSLSTNFSKDDSQKELFKSLGKVSVQKAQRI